MTVPVAMSRTEYENLVRRAEALQAARRIKIEGREIVGTASDGTEVQLGTTDDWEGFLRYLQVCSTPDLW